MSELFRISNLKCNYDNGDKPIQIKEFKIKRGEFAVIVGKSGTGKSTILEALGLLNNTFTKNNGSDIVFMPPNEKDISFRDLWQKHDNTDRSKLRKDHFTFIFQDTFMLNSFNNRENICLAQLCKNAKWKDAEVSISPILDKLGLESIDLNSFPMNASGGERQRMAFARAITSKFTVLFGDEPTGNLDKFHAMELFNSLYDYVKTNGDCATVIVTHNQELVKDYADVFAVLPENQLLDNSTTFRVESINGEKNWKRESDGRLIPDNEIIGVIERLMDDNEFV